MEYTHKPVLLDACIQALNIHPDGIYVDGTLGRAGHSREIAGRLTTGRLICIDRDQAAIDAAQDRLAPWLARVTLIHSNFSDLKEVLSRCGVSGAVGMLFDLGVSSHQLEDRIVKRTLAELARGCVCPPEFPVCVCGKKPQVRLVTRKPVTAGGAELEENPRARSAKLRVAEKCGFDL